MSKLAAFVGHSFANNDREVVSAFLEFFARVQRMNIGFTWDHAEEAEPKELSEKVRQKMEGKNLFIGICTGKEHVIATQHLRPVPLLDRLWAKSQHYESKTSDWIIQEIGYAVGKGMDIILMLESGVSKPGGLQGDLEYIPFVRAKPSEAFVKVLEMLQSLSPKTVPLQTTVPPEKEDATKPAGPGSAAESADEQEPSVEWSLTKFKDAILFAVFKGDEDKINNLRKVFSESSAGKDQSQRDLLVAFEQYARVLLGKKSDFAAIEQVAERNLTDPEIRRYFARCLEHYDQHHRAFENFEAAASEASDDEQRASFLSDAAVAKWNSGDKSAEKWVRERFAGLPITNGTRKHLLNALRQIADKEGSVDKWLIYTEARIELTPDDQDLRFALAYKYSMRGYNDLALYHYSVIPPSVRSGDTWNNIGAAYQELSLKTQAVKAYRRAEELKQTRAMSNIAFLLINAGFLKEAEEICQRATKVENYDKRVASAIDELEKANTRETEEGNKRLEAVKVEQAFLARMGKESLSPLPDPLVENWVTKQCRLAVQIRDGKFEASGSFTKPSVNSIFGIMASHVGSASQPDQKFSVNYSGQVYGRTICFKKAVKEDGTPSSLLTTTEESGHAIIEPAPGDIKVMVKPDGKPAEFETWSRVP